MYHFVPVLVRKRAVVFFIVGVTFVVAADGQIGGLVNGVDVIRIQFPKLVDGFLSFGNRDFFFATRAGKKKSKEEKEKKIDCFHSD